MDINKYRDKVNINLVKCVYKLRKQIMDIYEIKQKSEENHVNNLEGITVHIKLEEGYENTEFLSWSLMRLSKKLEALRAIYNSISDDNFNQDILADYDIDLKNETNGHLVSYYLESQIDKLIEYASCTLELCKIEDSKKNIQLKKFFTKLNKNMKAVLYNVFENNINIIQSDYTINLNNLGEKILVLSRKISKIRKHTGKLITNNKLIIHNEKSSGINNEKYIDDTIQSFMSLNEMTPKKNKKSTSLNLPNCETASNSDVQDYVVKRGDISNTSNENIGESTSDSSISKKSKKRKNDSDLTENEFQIAQKKIKKDKISELVNITLENINDGNDSKKTKFTDSNDKLEKCEITQESENAEENNEFTKNNNKENLNKYINKKKPKTIRENKTKQNNLLDSFIKIYKTKTKDSTQDEIKSNKSFLDLSEHKELSESYKSMEEHNLSDEENEYYENVESEKCDLYGNEKFLQVQMLLEEVNDQEYISDEVKAKLEVLFIIPSWNIPLSHQIETRLGTGPTKEQKDELLKHNIVCGPFTKIEDKKITKNFTNFCKEYKFEYDATPFLCWKNSSKTYVPHSERIKFVQYIGQDLPHRMLSSIYRRFKVLHTPVKKGRFTKDEDDIILTYTKHVKGAKRNEPMFSPLVKILNRSRPSLQTRYKYLVSEQGKKSVKWNKELDEKLLLTLMKVLDVKDYKRLQNIEIEHSVFEKIGNEMDLPPLRVKVHWLTKLSTQLFSLIPLRYDKLKVELLEKLIELKENDWRSINWQKVATNFDGCSSHFLAFIAKVIVRHNLPTNIQKDLKKCLRYAKKKIDNGISLSEKRNYLCRYHFTNGKLTAYK